MQLNEFLVRAKVRTYAGNGSESIAGDNSKELTYEEDEWKYRDRYFGSERFIGQELVLQDDIVIWAMNYCGGIIGDSISPEGVYVFLKKALRCIKEDRPFRGPRELQEGDFTYKNESDGTIDGFSGKEVILYRGKRVYELLYHGGRIKR